VFFAQLVLKVAFTRLGPGLRQQERVESVATLDLVRESLPKQAFSVPRPSNSSLRGRWRPTSLQPGR
jgi:hypothetical protein